MTVMDGTSCIVWSNGSVTVDMTQFLSRPRSRMYAIDPATASAVAGAVLDYYKNGKEGEWKASIGDTLNEILRTMELIVAAIADAVETIIADNNNKWTTFFSTNIRHPGLTWEEMTRQGVPLTDRQCEIVAGTFNYNFAPAVGNVTLHGEYRALGFILAPVVRLIFPYTLLALKLAGDYLPPRTAKSMAIKFAIDYLNDAVSDSDPVSLSNALRASQASLTQHVAYMEGWAAGRWVRVSDESRPGPRPRPRGEGNDDGDRRPYVRVAWLVGGAADPRIAETAVVSSDNPEFRAPLYDGYPGSIGVSEDEKARLYLTDRWINPNVAKRNSLSTKVTVLTEQVEGIRAELPVIKTWMDEN